MRPVSFEPVKVAVVVAVLGLSACGGAAAVTRPGGGTPPARVIVTPAFVSMGFGVPVRFSAAVLDSAGTLTADQAVTWRVLPASGPATISDSGVVTWSCYPGGTARVIAASLADTTVADTAQAVVALAGTAQSISSIADAATGQPASLDSLTDSVRVTLGADPSQYPCAGFREADLVVARAAGDTIVDRVPLDSTSATRQTVALIFHSGAAVGGVPQFPNGPYAMYVTLQLTGNLAPVRSSGISFTIDNP
jgi:hypothetical protein